MKQMRSNGVEDMWVKMLPVIELGEMVCLTFPTNHNRYFVRHEDKYYCMIAVDVFHEIEKINSSITHREPDPAIMRELFADAIMEELL